MLLPSRPAEKISLEDIPAAVLRGVGGCPVEALKSRDYLLVYSSQQEVLDLRPDVAVMDEVNLDPGGVACTARADVDNLTPDGERVDFVSRFFTPQCSVFEVGRDPVSLGRY